MAKITTDGLDELIFALDEVAAMPVEVIDKMLVEKAKVIQAAQKKKAKEFFGQEDPSTRQLEHSITIGKAKGSGKAERWLTVYPRGVRTDGEARRKVTNSEVAFVHEVGAPRRKIKAKQWMRAANEGAAPAATEAAFKVYDAWLKSKKL